MIRPMAASLMLQRESEMEFRWQEEEDHWPRGSAPPRNLVRRHKTKDGVVVLYDDGAIKHWGRHGCFEYSRRPLKEANALIGRLI